MHRRFLLFGKGSDLFFSQTARPKLVKQLLYRVFLRRVWLDLRLGSTNQYGDAINVELTESLTQFLGAASLNLLTMGQEIQHVRRLSHIPKIRRQDRVERLRNQSSNVSETLNDARRFFIVDVQHERQRQ